MIKTSGPAAGRLTGAPPLLGGRRSAGGAQLSADIVPMNTSLHLTPPHYSELNSTKMKLRRSSNSNTEGSEDSLIVFCANYRKEKLERIRQKYRNPAACLKCIRRGKKSTSSTPVVTRTERSEQRPSLHHLQQPPALFYTNLSPIPTGHNTEERIKRESLVRRKLFGKK